MSIGGLIKHATVCSGIGWRGSPPPRVPPTDTLPFAEAPGATKASM
ncbi:hypothetical protein I553_3867 [Mycobacterium xenopi 4042]|uniref:Uncharacterized protein n=1 Tax=Mycobacterium xenopi 4042 TaxID=1299334 RepID=X8ED48_MYCXE|nr:hypothetical protein I553_3867 [Mycobacterium xenopi 4042]